jgi:hypothetical protein
MFAPTTYKIRLAGDADETALEHIAQLDSARPLEHPILVGEIEGRVVAALDLDTERAIADPFVRTANLLAHLRVRAAGFEAATRTPEVADRIRAAMRRTRIAYG